MSADIQRTVYPEEVAHQLHVTAQARKCSPVIDGRSNHCATPPTLVVLAICLTISHSVTLSLIG